VAVALVLLVSKDPRPLITLTAAVIIGREITISALREWMAEIGQRRKVAVSQLGKYKTILQIVGLTCMLFRVPPAGSAYLQYRGGSHRNRGCSDAGIRWWHTCRRPGRAEAVAKRPSTPKYRRALDFILPVGAPCLTSRGALLQFALC